MLIQTAVQEFFEYLEHERGCSAATSRAYGADVAALLRFLGEIGVTPEIESLTRELMRRYVAWMGEKKGYRPGTVRRRIGALSSLCRYLVAEGEMLSNPCLDLALPKKRRRLPSVLTLEEARRMLAASEEHRNVTLAFRNRAIVGVLLYCGLRRAEVLELKVGDVDLKAGWLKVRQGKGMKDRLIPLLAEARELIADWLEFRPEVDHDYLFTGKQRMPLCVNSFIRMFKTVKEKAGLAREGVTPHTLRHTFASLLLQAGCDLVSIKEMLGHADLATTSIYLHVSAPHLQAAVGLHPLSCGSEGR